MAGRDYSWAAYEKRLRGIAYQLRAHPLPVELFWTDSSGTGFFWLYETEVDIYGQVTVKLEEDGEITRKRYTPVCYCFHFMSAVSRPTEIMRFEKEPTDHVPHCHDRACPGIHLRNPDKYGLDVEGFCGVLALRTGEHYIEIRRTPMEAKEDYNSFWQEERKKLGWA